MSQKQRGSLESLMLRNASDTNAIISFRKAEPEMDEIPDLLPNHKIN